MTSDARVEAGIDRRLSGQIRRPHFLYHRPGQNVVHVVLIEARLAHEAAERQALEVHGQLIGVDGGRLGEGESHAIDDHHVLFGEVAGGGVGCLLGGAEKARGEHGCF